MPPTLDQFCADLTETGLLSEDDVRDVVAALPPERKPREAQELIRELVRLHKLTVYQAQQIYQGQARRLHLGNYVVLDKIGQGGMGMVLKAEHKRMRRVVALKVIRPRSIESPTALKRFHREVETAAQLIHPNIVTAFDADEADGTNFLVMEYVDGTDLSTLVKLDGPLPLQTALDCVLQAARGLEYAHGKGIIHRDIKPRNLLLDRQGKIKILDMGLARVETSSGADQSDLTGSGQIMGTIDYMAPEQAVNPKHADQRADLYSLGITLWYLLVGKLPFTGETILEKLIAHREDPIPSLAVARRGVPRQLDAVFERMVAKKVQHRFASMAELIAELEQCRIDPSAPATIRVEPDQGAELKAFLQGISSASKLRRADEEKTTGRPRKHVPQSGETVCDGDSRGDTDHLTFDPALPNLNAAGPELSGASASHDSVPAVSVQAAPQQAEPPVPPPVIANEAAQPARAAKDKSAVFPKLGARNVRLVAAAAVGASIVVAILALGILALQASKSHRPKRRQNERSTAAIQLKDGQLPPRLTS
jgi:serine/threonine protein kinase